MGQNRRRLASASATLVAALAAACSAGTGARGDAQMRIDAGRDATTGPIAAPDPCAPLACEPARVVTTDAELLALAAGPGWADQGVLSSGCVPPTPELAVRGTVTLDVAGALASVPYCDDRCRSNAKLAIRAAGVECVEQADGGAFTGCRKARITDATVRLLRYRHLFYPRWTVPTIEILPSCGETSCAGSERLCEATSVCFTDVAPTAPFSGSRDHCKYCLGLPWQQCACWDGEGSLPDGTGCVFFLSGDVAASGRCVSGLCRY